ncbi:MAG TPA: isochorismatase family cysteine hydrolase [Xanthobacteraceae bacterium]|jgi:ureidoacrylate peracid hydrolase|nr:isochorismatase family cysteine hydrolase [Xanthobacteraceae bacterium]
MHKINLNPAVVEKILARRGVPHVFADLDPARTALLVVDMQCAYLDKELDNTFCADALDIVPNINRIAAALRAAGGLVVWIQNTATDESLSSWSTYNGKIMSPARRDKRFDGLREGSAGHAIWPGLHVISGDLTVQKTRYSAFIRGSSNLEEKLRDRAIETLIVTGTNTGTCCESTARDAMMLNFETIMVSDGNACSSDEEHNASLTAFYRNFGDVMSADEVIGYIQANAPKAKKSSRG